MRGVPVYRPRATPLHAARAAVAALWIAALAASALVLYHPLVLASIAIAAVGAFRAAGVRRELRLALRLVLVFALPAVLVNVLISRHGLTVFWRLGDLGPFGQGDLTVEALVNGIVIASKVGIVIALGLLASLTIDPDQLLSLCRRLSLRSALTASIALRIVPLLATDAQRLAEAQRTRPPAARGRGFGDATRLRVRLLTATMSGALDRSLDVAATLELRGFGTPVKRRWRSGQRRPLSRHDIAFLGSAFAVLSLSIAARVAGFASFAPYPLLHMPTSIATVALCIALPVLALLPFLDRRGVEPRVA